MKAFFFKFFEALMTTIHLDSSVSQTTTRAVLNASVLACTKTSAHDVYSHAIWVVPGDIHQFTLYAGDSMVVPGGATLTIWIFRSNPGPNAWSADFDLN
jgi:hypothetical protein